MRTHYGCIPVAGQPYACFVVAPRCLFAGKQTLLSTTDTVDKSPDDSSLESAERSHHQILNILSTKQLQLKSDSKLLSHLGEDGTWLATWRTLWPIGYPLPGNHAVLRLATLHNALLCSCNDKFHWLVPSNGCCGNSRFLIDGQ